jgi:hypothetical protein
MPHGSAKVAAMAVLAALLPLAQEAVHDAAEEGKKVILGMLIVGLVFAGWVILGELIHHRRVHRR